jgi:hypothetical protein
MTGNMQIVTGFDSSEPGETKEEELERYSKFLLGIRHQSQDSVLNAYTGLSKKSLRRLLHDAIYLEAKEARSMRPYWVSEVSVALDLPEDPSKPWLHAMADTLLNLPIELSQVMQHSTKGKGSLVFVDSLQARISLVAPTCMRFVLRQKWTVKDG